MGGPRRKEWKAGSSQPPVESQGQQPQRAECCQQPEKEWIPSPRALEVRPQPLGQNLDGTWSEAMKLRISDPHPWNYAMALISGLVVFLGDSSLWEESPIVWWVLRRWLKDDP